MNQKDRLIPTQTSIKDAIFHAQYFIPNEDDVDSDVLLDSDEEEEEKKDVDKTSYLPPASSSNHQKKEHELTSDTKQTSKLQATSAYPQMDEEIENYLNDNYTTSPISR